MTVMVACFRRGGEFLATATCNKLAPTRLWAGKSGEQLPEDYDLFSPLTCHRIFESPPHSERMRNTQVKEGLRCKRETGTHVAGKVPIFVAGGEYEVAIAPRRSCLLLQLILGRSLTESVIKTGVRILSAPLHGFVPLPLSPPPPIYFSLHLSDLVKNGRSLELG